MNKKVILIAAASMVVAGAVFVALGIGIVGYEIE